VIICIADVISADELHQCRDVLAAAPFRDGRTTAGWHARLVKRNLQAESGDAVVERLRGSVGQAIRRNPLFEMAARPKRVRPVLFSRYQSGMEYGSHVDDAVMAGADPSRTDIALTLFLSEPDGYDGGELIVETSGGEQSYKLPAGCMVVYPASTLHRVAPVTRGERLVAVTWVQSLVRDPAQRELLFELDTARRSLFEQHGKTREFDLLSKSVANLLRMWAEL
jgi:PKHD-type hydroxylase